MLEAQSNLAGSGIPCLNGRNIAVTLTDPNRGFERNRLWVLKNSLIRKWLNKLCARMPYKRLSRFS